jgi:propanediol dehydratase small subunit
VNGGLDDPAREGDSISPDTPAVSDLMHASECASRVQADADALCEQAGMPMALPTYDIVYDLLRAGRSSKESLCAIDAAIVKSQTCIMGEGASDAGLLATLLRELAESWQRLGNLHRADQLYGRTELIEEGLVSDGRSIIGISSTLQHWALLKLDMKEIGSAKELSERQVALARQAFEFGRYSPAALAQALRFHATILQELGLSEEAGAFEREAEAVSVSSSTCEGIFCTKKKSKSEPCNKIYIDKEKGPLCAD